MPSRCPSNFEGPMVLCLCPQCLSRDSRPALWVLAAILVKESVEWLWQVFLVTYMFSVWFSGALIPTWTESITGNVSAVFEILEKDFIACLLWRLMESLSS